MIDHSKSPCRAAWNNMYWNVHAKASPCWLTVGEIDRWTVDRSISDIWNGEHYKQKRQDLVEQKFTGRCSECKKDIDNAVWPLARAYSQYSVKKYPTMMEMELSNQCNLECVMCSGELSSGIRKNREGKPPLPMAYTDKFIEQLEEFIPHLEELRFNGGEPFAQRIVLDICDMVAEVNPKLKVNIDNNGTVYSKRVRKILEQNNVHINLSIDSLDPERYAAIRINGKLSKVFENLERYKEYCTSGGRELCIMVNPMRNNWFEMIDFLDFTNKHNTNLWYNTIRYPAEYAIWNLPSDELKKIYDGLQKRLDDWVPYKDKKNNVHITKHLIDEQIGTWLLDSYTRE